MKGRYSFTIIFLLILSLFLVACGNGNSNSSNDSAEADGEMTLNLSTPDPENSSITTSANHFADIVEEKSDGSIKVEVHPNGTLYGEDSSAAVNELGSGSLDLVLLSTSLYVDFISDFNVISVPYLFEDEEQFIDYLNSDMGDQLLDELDELEIEGVDIWSRPFRQITNSKQPIESPEDLKGLKLRTPDNSLWVDFFKEMKAEPSPMDFSELYNALQLGTVDGQENPVSVPQSSNFDEVQDYLTMSDHMADGWVLGMNQAKFDDLSDDQKEILQEASEETQEWKADYDEEESDEIVNDLEEKGMEVNELSADQKEEFMKVSEDLYPSFKETIENDELFQETLDFVEK